MLMRYVMYFLGIAVMAFGSYTCIQANIGVSPWDTLHIGLQKTAGLTIGIWSQIVGITVVLFTYIIAKVKPTLITLLNIISYGVYMDFYVHFKIVPLAHNWWQEGITFTAGLLTAAVGIGMYISPHFSAGPRDSLMLAIRDTKGWSIQRVRISIEVSVLIAGWLLGGPVSIGTLLVALLTGPLIQRTIPFWEKFMQRWNERAPILPATAQTSSSAVDTKQ